MPFSYADIVHIRLILFDLHQNSSHISSDAETIYTVSLFFMCSCIFFSAAGLMSFFKRCLAYNSPFCQSFSSDQLKKKVDKTLRLSSSLSIFFNLHANMECILKTNPNIKASYPLVKIIKSSKVSFVVIVLSKSKSAKFMNNN